MTKNKSREPSSKSRLTTNITRSASTVQHRRFLSSNAGGRNNSEQYTIQYTSSPALFWLCSTALQQQTVTTPYLKPVYDDSFWDVRLVRAPRPQQLAVCTESRVSFRTRFKPGLTHGPCCIREGYEAQVLQYTRRTPRSTHHGLHILPSTTIEHDNRALFIVVLRAVRGPDMMVRSFVPTAIPHITAGGTITSKLCTPRSQR